MKAHLAMPKLEAISPFSLKDYERPNPQAYRYDAEDLYAALSKSPAEAFDTLKEFDDSLRSLTESAQRAMLGALEQPRKKAWSQELRWYHDLADQFFHLTIEALAPILDDEALRLFGSKFGRSFFYRLQHNVLAETPEMLEKKHDLLASIKRYRRHIAPGGRPEHWSDWQRLLALNQSMAEAYGYDSIVQKQLALLGISELSLEEITALLTELQLRFVPLYQGLLEFEEVYREEEAKTWQEVEGLAEPLLYLPIYGTNASPRSKPQFATHWFYQMTSEIMAAEFSHVLEVPGNFLRLMHNKGYIRYQVRPALPTGPYFKLSHYRLRAATSVPNLFYLADLQVPVFYTPQANSLLDVPRWFQTYSEYTYELLYSDQDILYLQFNGNRQATLDQIFLGEAMTWEAIHENRYALTAFDHKRGEVYTWRRFLQLIEEILLAAAICEWSLLVFRNRSMSLQESFEVWPEILENYGLSSTAPPLAELQDLQLESSEGVIRPALDKVLLEPFAPIGQLLARILGLAYWDQLKQHPRLSRQAFELFMQKRFMSSGRELLLRSSLPDPSSVETIRRLAYKLAYYMEF